MLIPKPKKSRTRAVRTYTPADTVQAPDCAMSHPVPRWLSQEVPALNSRNSSEITKSFPYPDDRAEYPSMTSLFYEKVTGGIYFAESGR